MPHSVCASREALRKAVATRLQELPSGSVPYLIVPTALDAKPWMRWLSDNHPGLSLGLQIVTFPGLLRERWDFLGDERLLTEKMDRTLFMADALEDHCEAQDDLSVTIGVVLELSDAVEEMHSHLNFRETLAKADLSANPALDVIFRYNALIDAYGFVEHGEAFQVLAECERPNVVTICVDHDHLLPAEEAYLAATDGRMFTVDPVGRDASARGLSELVDRIYHAGDSRLGGPLEPTAAVRFASSAGVNAEPALVAQLVEEQVAAGIAPADIIVTAAKPTALLDRVAPLLAAKGIPSSGVWDGIFSDTPFGRTYLALRDAVGASMREEKGVILNDEIRLTQIAAITDVALSPFTPTSPSQARQLDREMRGNRTLPLSHQLEGLGIDEVIGFLQMGNEAAAFAMLAHGAMAHLPEDDLAARTTDLVVGIGNTFFMMLEGHRIRSAQLLYDIMKGLKIQLPYGLAGTGYDVETNDGSSVRFTTLEGLAQTNCKVAIICQLTATDYPLSMRADAKNALFRSIGLPREDTYLEDRRMTFKRALAAVDDVVVLERALNDVDAAPLRPSVLFEEVVDCYRQDVTATDDIDEGTALPKAFARMAVGDGVSLCSSRGENDLLSLFPSVNNREGHAVDAAGVVNLTADEVTALVSHGKEPVFSASQVEKYMSCPYSWFIDRKISPENLDASNDQLVLGSFAHNALRVFYDSLHDQDVKRVTAENLDECLKMFEMVFSSQIEASRHDEQNPLVIRDELQKREVARLGVQLSNVVHDDVEFLPRFSPTYLEWEFGKGDDVVEYAGHRFRGAIDRIDVDEDGHAVVVDYKGGLGNEYTPKVNKQTSELEIPHVQTLIYAQIARRYLGLDVVGAVYRSYKRRKVCGTCDGMTVGKEQMLDDALFDTAGYGFDGFNDLLDAVEEKVAAALDRLLAGEIPPEPAFSGSCDWCPAAYCPHRDGVAGGEA